ncbi:hypothetical protein ACHAWT_005309 [Skeletonema menzelii]
MLERGRCSCCVHHQITAVSCRRHLNQRLRGLSRQSLHIMSRHWSNEVVVGGYW